VIPGERGKTGKDGEIYNEVPLTDAVKALLGNPKRAALHSRLLMGSSRLRVIRKRKKRLCKPLTKIEKWMVAGAAAFTKEQAQANLSRGHRLLVYGFDVMMLKQQVKQAMQWAGPLPTS
jgi:hypothetical protein